MLTKSVTKRKLGKRGRPVVRRWNLLCRLMESSGFDDEKLAKAMYVKPRTVADWRRGEQAPDESGFNRLAGLLGGSAEELRADAPSLKKFRNRYADSGIDKPKEI